MSGKEGVAGVRALRAIYGDPAVRRCILDFLGGGRNASFPTALYVARSDGRLPTELEKIPAEEWESSLERPGDLARSLADRKSFLVHLDIEYVNFDSPEEAFVDPWRCFRLQEPVVSLIEEELSSFGIRPLHLLTGQGHHFVWQVNLGSEVFRSLVDEAGMWIEPDTSGEGGTDPGDRAFFTLGCVMEFLGHRIKRSAAGRTEIPVDLTAVELGRLPSGRRELISIDLSEYGDPLAQRVVRIPFTHYEKPWLSGMVERLGLESSVPRFVALPLHEIDVAQALVLRQSAETVIDLARRTVVEIPDQEEGMKRLLESYRTSSLSRFHRDFFSQRPVAGEDARGIVPEFVPPCVGRILDHPNDLLLKPAGIQLVTRFLMAHGGHPRDVASLVRSHFEDPAHGWSPSYWEIYDPAMRAEFYVRLFSGQVATGLDEGVDFNCVSTQEKHFCPGTPCFHDLSVECNALNTHTIP